MKASTYNNKLGLGTVQFGLDYGISNNQGITGLDEVKAILKFAKEAGIDLIDTAYAYGKSEEVLGIAGVGGFRLVTKFLPELNNFSIKKQVKTSIERLKVRQLYGLLAHRPLDLIEKPEGWDYLLELKKTGIIQKAGFSFSTTEEIDLVLTKGYMPDLIQVPYNYFDKRFESYMRYLKGQGCEIHARSAFLQGLFFVTPKELSGFFVEVKPALIELQKHKEALPGLLLKYCIMQPFIDKVVFGVNNMNQLQENCLQIETQTELPEIELQIDHKILTPSEWPTIK